MSTATMAAARRLASPCRGPTRGPHATGQAPLPVSSPRWIAAYHRKSSRPGPRRLRPWTGHHLAVGYSCSSGQGLVPLPRFASRLWVAAGCRASCRQVLAEKGGDAAAGVVCGRLVIAGPGDLRQQDQQRQGWQSDQRGPALTGLPQRGSRRHSPDQPGMTMQPLGTSAPWWIHGFTGAGSLRCAGDAIFFGRHCPCTTRRARAVLVARPISTSATRSPSISAERPCEAADATLDMPPSSGQEFESIPQMSSVLHRERVWQRGSRRNGD
jgi:hypothetical protein